MELLYLLKILYRRKWILMLCSLIAVLTAFFLTLDSTKVYRSVSQLSTGFTVSDEIKLSNETFNIPQIDVKFNNTIENITSSKVVALLSYKLLIHDLNSGMPFRQISEKTLKNNPDLRVIDKPFITKLLNNKIDSLALLNTVRHDEKVLEDILNSYNYDVDNLKKNLSVGRFQRTDYINISFKSENPELSAYVVNTLIVEFRRYFDSFRKERSSESITALDSMVKKRKLELDQKIAMKTQFQSDSAVLSPELMNSSNLEQINLIETSLADERAKAQSYAYQINQLEKQIQAAGIVNNGSAVTGNKTGNEEYMALRQQRSDLYADYVRKGATDAAIKKQLDDLDARLREKVPTSAAEKSNPSGDIQATAKNNLLQKKIEIEGQLQSAQSKISYYNSKLKDLKGGMGSMVSMGATLQQLDKEIALLNSEYTTVKDKLNLATNLTDGGSANFKQTLYGQSSLEAEPSKRFLIILLAGVAAFILTFLVLIFIEYIDQSIKTPSQFNRQTGLKLLGVVNWVPMKGQKISEKFMQLGNPGDGNRKDSFRELLRKIRFELENSNKRIFLFTSTEPQQGKTTLVQAIAFSLSLGKKKVLILDTNFCNNDITVMNGAGPTLEKFSGNGHLVDPKEIAALVTSTGIENVDIIGCQGGDYTPSEILPRNHLLNYLKDLLTVYDFIFMEGAPLNGYADTKELVKYSDGVIAIFSATTEIKQTDIASISFLKTLDNKFLGAILNKVENLNINN
jgi:succinoglycan biosynthesis transport protein ExoP